MLYNCLILFKSFVSIPFPHNFRRKEFKFLQIYCLLPKIEAQALLYSWSMAKSVELIGVGRAIKEIWKYIQRQWRCLRRRNGLMRIDTSRWKIIHVTMKWLRIIWILMETCFILICYRHCRCRRQMRRQYFVLRIDFCCRLGDGVTRQFVYVYFQSNKAKIRRYFVFPRFD